MERCHLGRYLTIELHLKRWVRLDGYLAGPIDVEGICARGEIPSLVQDGGEEGRDQPEGVLRAQNDHIQHAVPGLVLMDHGYIELDLGEVDEQHSHSLTDDLFAIEVQVEGGYLGKDIGDSGGEVGHLTEQLLAALSVFHDGGIVSSAGHHQEAEALPMAQSDLAQVEVHDTAFAEHLRYGMGLGGACQVGTEEVRSACREGQDGDARISQKVGHRGQGAISAGGYHAIEPVGVSQKGAQVRGSITGADDHLVPVFGIGADEVEDSAVA